MGIRVTWRGRQDLPFNGRFLDYDPPSGAVGPFTRKQLVELFWRVKEIHVTGSVSVNYTAFVDGSFERLSVTGEIDYTLTRISFIKEFPLTEKVESDELDVFRDNLFLRGRADFGQFDDFGRCTFEESGIYATTDGEYFATPDFAVSTDVGDPTIVALAGHMPKSYEGEASYDYFDLTKTLDLTSGSVDFPIQVVAYFNTDEGEEPVSITSATVNLEITKWIPYAKSDGSPQWEESTGEWIKD